MNDKLFHLLFWGLFMGVMMIRAQSVRQTRRAGQGFMPDAEAVQHEGWSGLVIRVLGFLLVLGLLVAIAINPAWMQQLDFYLPAWVRWTGFGIGLASLALWTWAQTTLGRQWSAQVELREAHQLVTQGPYARVRHPLYAALVGIALSFALVTANWLFAAFGLLVIAFLPLRIRREEQMMLENVPGYAEYAARVRYRIFPGIW